MLRGFAEAVAGGTPKEELVVGQEGTPADRAGQEVTPAAVGEIPIDWGEIAPGDSPGSVDWGYDPVAHMRSSSRTLDHSVPENVVEMLENVGDQLEAVDKVDIILDLETIEALAAEELNVRETMVDMACTNNDFKQHTDCVSPRLRIADVRINVFSIHHCDKTCA